MKRARPHLTEWLLFLASAVVLAVVILPSLGGELERHEQIRADVERLEAAEGRFRELVIGLRHGVTSNYDEANYWQQRIESSQRVLIGRVEGLGELHKAVSDYVGSLDQHARHWEDFKRHNSVVRNSLRYFQRDFPAFISALHRGNRGDTAHEILAALQSALFLQSLGVADRHDEIVTAMAAVQPHMQSYPASVRNAYRHLFG